MRMNAVRRLLSGFNAAGEARPPLPVASGRSPEKVPEAGPMLPYPVQVSRRDPASETVPPGGGVECFDTPAALALNRARPEHLAALGLSPDCRSGLDVGCGVGHLARFFLARGCRVVCVDGREENIRSLQGRYPGLEAHVGDIQSFPLGSLGRFDVILSYGLLYHLEDPVAALRNLAS